MNAVLRNILAVLAGLVLGGALNMFIVSVSGEIVPLPEGVDPNDIESIKANMHRYETMHFIMPFLAHALGTLLGAFTCVKIAASGHQNLAIGIGAFFFLGGLTMVLSLPSPMWFNALDLIVAYIPMGILGYRLAR